MLTGNPELRAGAARADITPELGIQLAGDIGRWRPVEEIRDPLWANVLALDWGGERVCLLSLDLLAATQPWVELLRIRVAAAHGLPPERLILHVTQNHAAPSLGHFFVKDSCPHFTPEHAWLRGGDDRYHEPTVARCVDAVGEALARLEPVTVASGRAIDGRVAFNRRFILRNGASRMGGRPGDPAILCSEGVTDPEVGVLTLTNQSGRTVAALLHFTCHPCHGYPHRYVIGDWPGAWAAAMREQLGGDCVPLVVNGCCGNVIHANPLDPAFASDYRSMAAKLTESALKALSAMTDQPPSLAVARQVLRLPLRELEPERIAAARKLLADRPEPVWRDPERTAVEWDWVYAAATLDLLDTRSRDPLCDYEIQTVRLGDTALVTLMGEPFVQAQLEIKERSPAPFTQVAHFCHGYCGYVPTREALRRGGYETRTANWSKFAPEALERIVEEAVRQLHSLFANPMTQPGKSP